MRTRVRSTWIQSGVSRRAGNGRRGAVMLETLIGATIFFGLTFMTIDLGRVGYEWMTLNHVVKEAAHWGSLGVTEENISRKDTVSAKAYSLWEEWGFDRNALQIQVRTLPGDALSSNVAVDGTGDTGDYLIVEGTLTTSLGSFLGIFNKTGNAQTVTIVAKGVARNE